LIEIDINKLKILKNNIITYGGGFFFMKKKLILFAIFMLGAFICINAVSAASTTSDVSKIKLTSTSKSVLVHVVYLNSKGNPIKKAKVGDTVTCAIYVTNTGKTAYKVKVKNIPARSVNVKLLYAKVSKGSFKKGVWNVGTVKYHGLPMFIMVAKLLSTGTDVTHVSLSVNGKSINQAVATLKVQK
jgi:hypothetical protein